LPSGKDQKRQDKHLTDLLLRKGTQTALGKKTTMNTTRKTKGEKNMEERLEKDFKRKIRTALLGAGKKGT